MMLSSFRSWFWRDAEHGIPWAAEAEKQKLQEVMEKAARAAADAHRFGRYGFFLYDQTGEEQYRTWIERNAEWLKNSPQSENGVFGCVEDSSRKISGSVMFSVYPFYMEYETRYHNKAGVRTDRQTASGTGTVGAGGYGTEGMVSHGGDRRDR